MNYNLIPKDELYHFGVLGMKWGVRKSSGSSRSSSSKKSKRKKKTTMSERIANKNTKRKERIHNSVDRIGVLGTSYVQAGNYSLRKGGRKIATHVINMSVNKYISNNNNKYFAKIGADYARRAAITGLSVSQHIDDFKSMRNMAETWLYGIGYRD